MIPALHRITITTTSCAKPHEKPGDSFDLNFPILKPIEIDDFCQYVVFLADRNIPYPS